MGCLKHVVSEYNTLVFQGPFDVCRKVFVGGEETARMTINDKSDLFFQRLSVRTAVRPGELPDRHTSCSKVQPNPSFELHPVSMTCLSSQTRTSRTLLGFVYNILKRK